ncbi:N-acylneuraminate-9-phosphatase-like [Saccoglossus kowalevskii]|uniref:N-acylneuraminate-9-phosphatase-like n=1 Tax=Saccoglossus kowalevskii TaxID=10224 RepID=A0ABM0GUT0_SACKO|nr:PREDICTED: N-acylneuraminate-9-phosphatase-like [Saccoglossus kowalevskii]
MSGKSKPDYKAVMRAIKELLTGEIIIGGRQYTGIFKLKQIDASGNKYDTYLLKDGQKVKTYLREKHPERNVDKIVCDYKKKLTNAEIDPEQKLPVDEWRIKLWKEAIENGSPVSSQLAKEVYELWKTTRLQGIYFTEEVKTLLVELRKNHWLVLMTNGDSKVQREKVLMCKAEDYFDGIIISGDHPHAKPHPSIYEVAFKMFSVNPKQCIMIGDNLKTDIQGGLNSGLSCNIWINPSEAEPSGCDPEPCFSIPSVLQLQEVLDTVLKKKSRSLTHTWEVSLMSILTF